MDTVIAKTKKSIMGGYIACIVMGAILFVLGVVSCFIGILAYFKYLTVIFITCGAAVMGSGIGWTIYIATRPDNCITFDGSKLHLADGLEFSPSELAFCSARTGGLDGAIFDYGTLKITVRNSEYKFRFVQSADGAVAKLNALKAQFTAIETIQRQIVEKNAANNAQSAESNGEQKSDGNGEQKPEGNGEV